MERKKETYLGAGLLPFDPIVLVRDVARRWLLILLVALTVGFGAYIMEDRAYTPVYQTRTTFVVTARGSSTTVYANLTSTSKLATLFTELLNSSIMRKTIVEELGVSSFDGTISTAVIPSTNLITMTVTSGDPRMAFLATRAIIENHETLTYQVDDSIVLEVLQQPSVPTAPRNFSNAQNQLKRMTVLAALAMTVLLAVASFLRNAVRSGHEARRKLDCDYLGEIPHERKYKTTLARLRRKKASILINNPLTGFPFVESIRKLSRRVEQHMGSGKVLLVTSLLENEGKSTVAVNLALDMAQKGKQVLLIDCDLHKPACHAVLEQWEFKEGIKEVLLGHAGLPGAAIRYRKSGLYLLLANKGDRTTSDLITSRRMGTLLDWARENFDCVVLDLPPMNAVSDAEGMADLADAALLVVRQNVAVAPSLNKAIGALEGRRAKLLGCVLNNVYATRLSAGTGYGYGYGYGGYRKYGRYGHYGQYGKYGPDSNGK